MVSILRSSKKPQNQKRDPKASEVSRWGILVFHDIQCSESEHHAGGMEYVPVDLEALPGFVQSPTIPPLEWREELDRSKGDNYQCGLFDKFAPALDCRYYYEEMVIPPDEDDMERMRYLQRSYVDPENDWPQDEGDQLFGEVLLKGRDAGQGEEPVLGRTKSVGDV